MPKSSLASKLSWAYYPRTNIIFYRCTVLSNFSSALVPDPNKYWSVLCEIGMLPNMPIDHEKEIIDQTINGIKFVIYKKFFVQTFNKIIKVIIFYIWYPLE